MKKYEYVAVTSGTSVLRDVIDGHREIIDKYAAKGYRYAGYIPTKVYRGTLYRLDLIFEIDVDEELDSDK